MEKKVDLRLAALRRFAVAISVLTIVGHLFLGFEQSWAHVVVALATGYSLELFLEWVDARAGGRAPRFLGGGLKNFVEFLLPVHIGSLAVALLLYPNERLVPIMFAVSVLVGSKYIFRVQTEKGYRHFLNPSNTGIAVTLLVFSWVGMAPPYMFTENLEHGWDWFLPALFVVIGTFLNAKFTKRIPLIAGWLGAYAVFSIVRSVLLDVSAASVLAPMTGVAFLLFTFYMVTDPGTTPFSVKGQVFFGVSVAFLYHLLVMFHVVFGIFFSLFIVCSIRGMYMQWSFIRRRRARMVAEAIEVPEQPKLQTVGAYSQALPQRA